MKQKRKIALLSVATIPAVITMAPTTDVQAATNQVFSGTIMNPDHVFDALPQSNLLFGTEEAVSIEASNEQEFKDAIKAQFKNYSTSFVITYTGSIALDLQNIITSYVPTFGGAGDEDNEYIAKTITSVDYLSSGYKNNIVTFTVKYHTTKTQETTVDTKIQQIISAQLPNIDTMSDFEKVKKIHDYVVTHASYSPSTKTSPHSAYTLLQEGKGVSQAYALVTYRLLKAAGLEAHFVSGKIASGAHAWNIVKVDNQWYHLDTTWDDSTFSNVSDATSDFVRYKYFLMPSSAINTSHSMPTDYPLAGKTIDDAKYQTMETIQQPVQEGSVLYFGSTTSPYTLSKLDLAVSPLTVSQVVTSTPHTTKKRIVIKDDWLFFSDDANGGYLTKVQTNGQNLTVLDKTNASDLKIVGSNLEYKKADNTKGTISLTSTNSGPTVGEVGILIGKIGTDPYVPNPDAPNPYDHSYIDAVIAAKLAYDKLTSEQQQNVLGRDSLEDIITSIQSDQNTIYKVMLKTALLDETAKSFKTDVETVRGLYNSLTADQKLAVKNKNILDAAWTKLNNYNDLVDTVRMKFNEINFNYTSYYQRTKEARAAYDALTLAQRELLATDLTKLTTAEKKMADDEAAVFDINYRLDLLNNRAADFKDSFEYIKLKIEGLTDNPGTAIANKKTLIKKLDFYNESQITYNNYKATADALRVRLDAITSTTPLDTVQALNTDFHALNDAQKKFLVTNFEADLKTALQNATAAQYTAAYVIDKIDALDVSDTNFINNVKDVQDAFEVLDSTEQGKVNTTKLDVGKKIVDKIKTIINNINTLPKEAADVTNTESYKTSVQNIENHLILLAKNLDLTASVEAPEDNTIDVKLNMKNYVDLHITNKTNLTTARDTITKGEEVNILIEGLAADATYAQVKAVRDMYDALTPIAQLFVTKLSDLEAHETRTNQAEASEVATLINALNQTATDFITKLDTANKRFNNLSPALKALIDNPTKLKLTELNRIATARVAVYNAIEAISEADVNNYVAKYTTAKTAYDALTVEEKTFITNITKLTAAQANVDAAKAVTDAIDVLTKDSTEEAILAAETKYNALSDFQKKLVTNYSKLEPMIDKAYGKDKAEAVISMISKLDEKKTTFAVDVRKAREAYEALTTKQKEYVTNVADLVAAEEKVADLVETSEIAKKMIAQIAAINDTIASFKTDVEVAKSAYAALPEAQMALVTNYSTLTAHQATYDTYHTTAKQLEGKITELNNTSPDYQSKLSILQGQYNNMNAAQKAFVPEYAVKLLSEAQSSIEAVRNVTKMILALNSARLTFHADVANARAAYNALIKNYGVYLPTYLEDALEAAEALVTKDKSAARKVVDAINSLSSESVYKEIERARRVYNSLTTTQRTLVTNLQTLIDFETGKLSYNYSGIPSGEDTGKDDEPTTEEQTLPNFAAVPGERTSMTKSPASDKYKAKIFVDDEIGNNERFVLTTKSNVTAIIPPTVTIIGEKTGTMSIEIKAEPSLINFKATLDNQPVTFATEVQLIVESVPAKSVVYRVDQSGKRTPATYSVDGNQYTISTKESDSFIIVRPSSTFTDIGNDSHREYIEALAEHEIIQSTANGQFNPSRGITRAEFASMMARALEIYPTDTTSFSDIRGKSYENDVQALYEIGIIKGVSPTAFGPDRILTRQQAAMMVERMLDYVGFDTTVWESPQFTDASQIADNAESAVALMQSLGIVSGKANGTFDPNGQLTRSQLAKILYKALETADLL